MSTPSPLPNPNTPLAWLNATIANDFEASCYLYVATLGAFIWDWVMAWPDEYRILFKTPIRLSKVIYCISRIAAFSYILTSTIFQIAPVDSCQGLQVSLASCLTVSVPATSALFYIRICAIFHYQRPVVVIFGILWLSILGSAFTVPFAISGQHIGTTSRCINSNVKSFSSSVIIANTVNDTLVFISISLRLVSFSMHGDTWKAKLRSFFRGDGLPRFSKMLLQGGQMYYFATVALNILTMAMILTPTVNPIFRAMFTVPNMALENAMATRVFRAIQLGIIPRHEGSTPSASGQLPTFLNHGSRGAALVGRGPPTQDVYPLETRVFDHRAHIEISKTLETRCDMDDLPVKPQSLTDMGDLDVKCNPR